MRSWKMYYFVFKLLFPAFILYTHEVSGEHDLLPPQDVRMWIEKCTLFLNWSATQETLTCKPYEYALRITSNKPRFDTHLSVARDKLDAALSPINSSTTYLIRLYVLYKNVTISGCHNRSVIYSEPFKANVSTHNDVFLKRILTKKVSESLKLSCPLSGAYRYYKVKWYHLIGVNQEVVGTYQTRTVRIEKLTLLNRGRYICEVYFQPCAPYSGFFRNTTVNIQGPPLILSSARTIKVSKGNRETYIIDVVSFPSLDNDIKITNEANEIIHDVGYIEPEEVEASVDEKKIKLPGYKVNISFQGISAEWLGEECTVVLTNEFGSSYFRFMLEKEAKDTFNIVTFLRKNTTILLLCGGAVLVLLIILTVTKVMCSNYLNRKNNKKDVDSASYNESNTDHGKTNRPGTSNTTYVYARPISFKKSNPMQDIREQEILEERKQIASLYSYGGFSWRN